MTYEPNPVQHAVLENRSAGQVALHIHYTRPHSPQTFGLFLGNLAAFMQGSDGILMQTEISQGGEVICLVPVVPTNEVRHFKAAATELGYNGPLDFIQEGDCSSVINSPSPSWH